MIRSEFESFEPGAWQEDGLLRSTQSRPKRFISPRRDVFRSALTAAVASAVATVFIGASWTTGMPVRPQPGAEIHHATLVDPTGSASTDEFKVSRQRQPGSDLRDTQSGDASPEYWAKLMGSMKSWKRLPDDDPNDDIDPAV